MSDELNPCEVVEVLVEATSECPATDVIVVVPAWAQGVSAVVLGMTLQPVDTAHAVATPFDSSYAMVIETGSVVSEVEYDAVASTVLTDRARARDRAFVLIPQLAVDEAAATGSIALMDTPVLLVDAGVAMGAALPTTQSQLQFTDTGRATDRVWLGMQEAVESTGAATNEVVLLRNASALVLEDGVVVSEVWPSAEPPLMIEYSSAHAVSSASSQLATGAVLITSADAAGEAVFKDPAHVAWVLNTESTGVSWYDNFHFESVAQTPDKVLAVGPDGLYELVGATDAGETIDAVVVRGFDDFGTPQTKRVDALYFGYTCSGQLSVTAEVLESGHPPSEFLLEQRPADAPRNSRIMLGKGMWGRYWRMTIRNVNGADFTVRDVAADVAVSPRRL